MTVLDTSAVVSGRLPSDSTEIAISVVTLAELQFGVLVARSPDTRAERLRRLSVLEQEFEPLPVDAMVARSYGRLAAAVVAAGRQPRARALDLLIAATAHAHGAQLYTANPRDLRGVEGLVDIVPVGSAPTG